MELTEENVREWIAEIGTILGLKLRYSPLLHQRLADGYKNYACCLKLKKNSRLSGVAERKA